MVRGSGEDSLVHLLHTGHYDRCDFLCARLEYEIHAVGIDLLLDRIVSQKGDTQYGSGGDIFECISPSIAAVAALFVPTIWTTAPVSGVPSSSDTVPVTTRFCAEARHTTAMASRMSMVSFFIGQSLKFLVPGAQAGPRSAKVAARPLHSESVSSFWKVPVRWLNRAAR